MRASVVLLPFACLFFSCSNESGTTHETLPEGDTTAVDGTIVNQPGITPKLRCYTWVSGKDTIKLQLVLTDNLVTGELHYLWFERDNNHGTIKGEMRGDTLFADYTFMAEGMESVRQEFFLKKGEGFVIGEPDYEHAEEPFEGKEVAFTGAWLKPIDCK